MMNKDSIKILVCCHKLDSFKSDNVYMPIHVGKQNSLVDLGIQGDDKGDNISSKNVSYCELTGLYWAWKNLKEVDYIGLCHYRRYFNFYKTGSLFSDYTIVRDIESLNLDVPPISKLLKNHDIVLPKPRVLPYSIYTNYCCSHLSKDIKLVEEIISEKYPQYKSSIIQVFRKNNRISHYNMFIMKWEEFNKYCGWLFSILEEAERRIDISSYDDVQKRIYGYLAERMLNLYVYHNKLEVKYCPVYKIDETTVLPSVLSRLQRYLRDELSFILQKQYRLK